MSDLQFRSVRWSFKEMQACPYENLYSFDLLGHWTKIKNCNKSKKGRISTCWGIEHRQTIATKAKKRDNCNLLRHWTKTDNWEKTKTIVTCWGIEQRQQPLHQIWPSPPQPQLPAHDDDGDIDKANDDRDDDYDGCGDEYDDEYDVEDGCIIWGANKSSSTPPWGCQ